MEKKILYKLKRSKRAKRMRLAVYCDGSIVITSPFGIQQSLIEKFLTEKKQWIIDKLKIFKTNQNKSIPVFSQKNYLENKDKALVLIKEKLEKFNAVYGFTFNKIFIKNQKTKWGSCSSRKNLNFNYKILFLSQEQQDYIIVHELCHLKEMNHSKKFWALVEKAIPEYTKIKKSLRGNDLF